MRKPNRAAPERPCIFEENPFDSLWHLRLDTVFLSYTGSFEKKWYWQGWVLCLEYVVHWCSFCYWQLYQYSPLWEPLKLIIYTDQFIQANNFLEIWAICHGVVIVATQSECVLGGVNWRNAIRWWIWRNTWLC